MSSRQERTATTLLPVLSRRDAKAWPAHHSGAPADYRSLSSILTSPFATDAYFAAYSVPEKLRRLAGDAPSLTDIPMVVLAFDVDDPEAHRAHVKSAPAWFRDQRMRIDQLFAAHRGGFAFRTLGGVRIVFRLPRPFVLREASDILLWRSSYLRAGCYLARRFNILIDPKCSDWPRLHRVPHGTRNPSQGPEHRVTIGDPQSVGVWHPFPPEGRLEKDLATAERLAHSLADWGPVPNVLRSTIQPTSHGARVAAVPTRSGAYVDAAIRRACELVAAAQEGNRNPTLNDQAFSLARFDIEADRIVQPLTSAAIRAGLPIAEISATIRSAMGARGR